MPEGYIDIPPERLVQAIFPELHRMTQAICGVAVSATQAHLADRIRAEMVCCDIHERLTAFMDPRGGYVNEPAYRALKRSLEYHPMCDYGEWAARIVEGRGDGSSWDQEGGGAGQEQGT